MDWAKIKKVIDCDRYHLNDKLAKFRYWSSMCARICSNQVPRNTSLCSLLILKLTGKRSTESRIIRLEVFVKFSQFFV